MTPKNFSDAEEATPFAVDLLDFLADTKPIVLQIACIVVFSGLFAVAPTFTCCIVVFLLIALVLGALNLRGQLAISEQKLRDAARIERGACEALQIAIAHAEALDAELAEVRRRPDVTSGDPIYRRIGLDPDAPDYIVQAARRAHRVALHPDQHPPERRQTAHDRYVTAEAAFDEIKRRRGA